MEKETFKFNGLEFDTELEAKYAYLFNLMGIRYEYKQHEIDIYHGFSYTPSFYLPDYDSYVHVKRFYIFHGEAERSLLKVEKMRIVGLIGTLKKPVILVNNLFEFYKLDDYENAEMLINDIRNVDIKIFLDRLQEGKKYDIETERLDESITKRLDDFFYFVDGLDPQQFIRYCNNCKRFYFDNVYEESLDGCVNDCGILRNKKMTLDEFRSCPICKSTDTEFSRRGSVDNFGEYVSFHETLDGFITDSAVKLNNYFREAKLIEFGNSK